MKKIIGLFLLLPLLSRAQNSYTVSNRPGLTANFATLQGAVDSVPAGSTLYLFPSPIDYGNVRISKKVLIVGTGYMLELNSLPYTHPNTEGVTLSSVYFMPGSDNSYIEGLQITGLTLNSGSFYRVMLDNVNNVTINRCMADIWSTFPGGNIVVQTKNSSNCTFSQCYLSTFNLQAITHSGGEFYIELGNGSQNLQFKNNLFDDRSTNGGFTFNHNVDPRNYGTVIFTNNTFNCDIYTTNFCNYTYLNNFFITTDFSGTTTPQSSGMTGPAGFNITNAVNLFPANSNNVQGVSIDSIFVSSQFGYHSFDQGWQLQPNSFARHYASDGGEVGAFGGYQPYVLSGIPNFPFIYSLDQQSDSSKRGNILVHIKGQAITN